MQALRILALALLAVPAAASTLVLEVTGVAGQSQLPGYALAIDVDSYAFNSASFGGTASTSLSLTGPVDSSFPALLIKCLEGTNLGTVTMSVLRENSSVWAELELTAAVCTSASIALARYGDQSQTYAFEFADATWVYFDNDPAESSTTDRASSTRTFAEARLGQPAALSSGIANCNSERLFLDLADIKGDSDADGHKDWVDAYGASWGAANFGGARVFYGLDVTGYMDRALPPAYEELLAGAVLDPITLELACQKKVAMEIVLTNAALRYTDSSGVVPRYGYTFEDYEEVEITYTPITQQGTTGPPITVGWDLVNDVKL